MYSTIKWFLCVQLLFLVERDTISLIVGKNREIIKANAKVRQFTNTELFVFLFNDIYLFI